MDKRNSSRLGQPPAKQMVRAVHRFPRLSESDKDKLKAEERAVLEACAFRAIGSLAKMRIGIGQIFIRLKTTLKHGEWDHYYEKTFGLSGVSLRLAERYMRRAAKAEREINSSAAGIVAGGGNKNGQEK
jgi:hypothetical protein